MLSMLGTFPTAHSERNSTTMATFFVFAPSTTYGDLIYRGEYSSLAKAKARLRDLLNNEGKVGEVRSSYDGQVIYRAA